MFCPPFSDLFSKFLLLVICLTLTPSISANYWVLDDSTSEVPVNGYDFIEIEDSYIVKPPSDVYWLKFDLSESDGGKILTLQTPSLNYVDFYVFADGQIVKHLATGDKVAFSKREIRQPSIAMHIPKLNNAAKLFIRIENTEGVVYAVSLDEAEVAIENLANLNIIKSIYFGIMLVMFLYNLFIFTFTKDKSYLYYSIYIVAFLLAQASLEGYTQLWFFSNAPTLYNSSGLIFSAISGLFAILFAVRFLDVRKKAPKAVVVFYIFFWSYALVLLLEALGLFAISTAILNINGILIGFWALSVALYLAKKGQRVAKFYVFAWSLFLISLFLYVLRNLGLMPVNDFTNNVLLIGSATEVVLLSLALADRINSLRKEKEASQAAALQTAQEKEQLIREQNIELEKRVDERTIELQESNEELRVTLDNLKETQSQLVDAEKMASLGQLTAGIAHEINNPINFVTSNITPLRRDLDDIYEIVKAYSSIEPDNFAEGLKEAKEVEDELEYDYLKTEINSLVDGISEGANRTKEIVQGLRTFSRLDEDAVKLADLHENIRSTMVLLNNKLNGEINIEEDFDPNISSIECYPGKLNQVFMNILNNAIYAVQHKNYEDGERAKISLKTKKEGHDVTITISDNGIGMSPETQKKIFEPFFTTKDVGEGTGLGMSIVFKIIQKHNGNVVMHSELGRGTDFNIHLPISQPSEFQ
jgi:two-component system NtrC family sensor kinase